MVSGNMRRALRILVVIIVGTVLGLVATWATVIRGTMGGDIIDGPWHTSLYVGSSRGSPYLRANIAVHGLLALGREETIYYTAANDSDGHALDGHCVYQIDGRDPPARWWSITAYGADDFLIRNDADRYSVSMNTVTRRADGTFAVTLSKAQVEGNRIPIAEEHFDLTIRLYHPQAEVAANPARVALPVIWKIACE
jgi:hypothetical protein